MVSLRRAARRLKVAPVQSKEPSGRVASSTLVNSGTSSAKVPDDDRIHRRRDVSRPLEVHMTALKSERSHASLDYSNKLFQFFAQIRGNVTSQILNGSVKCSMESSVCTHHIFESGSASIARRTSWRYAENATSPSAL